jgi:hypothetical protein
MTEQPDLRLPVGEWRRNDREMKARPATRRNPATLRDGYLLEQFNYLQKRVRAGMRDLIFALYGCIGLNASSNLGEA